MNVEIHILCACVKGNSVESCKDTQSLVQWLIHGLGVCKYAQCHPPRKKQMSACYGCLVVVVVGGVRCIVFCLMRRIDAWSTQSIDG